MTEKRRYSYEWKYFWSDKKNRKTHSYL